MLEAFGRGTIRVVAPAAVQASRKAARHPIALSFSGSAMHTTPLVLATRSAQHFARSAAVAGSYRQSAPKTTSISAASACGLDQSNRQPAHALAPPRLRERSGTATTFIPDTAAELSAQWIARGSLSLNTTESAPAHFAAAMPTSPRPLPTSRRRFDFRFGTSVLDPSAMAVAKLIAVSQFLAHDGSASMLPVISYQLHNSSTDGGFTILISSVIVPSFNETSTRGGRL